MQMKRKFKEEKASMAVYVTVVLTTFLIILTTIYFSSTAVRKSQLKTVTKVKESYEADLEYTDRIYKIQADKLEPKIEYVKNGLILHYDGIDNTENGHSESATTWKDLSGNGNDGTLSKQATSTSFYWDSNSLTTKWASSTLGSYVDTNVKLNGKERTIIYTVDATNLTGTIFGDTNATGNKKGLFNYQTFIANRTENAEEAKYMYTFAKAGIYNYAVTLSATEMKFYVNGKLNATVANTAGLATSNNLRLMAAYYEGQNATNLKMYNFMVYDRVLEESEIQNNYGIIKERFNITTE